MRELARSRGVRVIIDDGLPDSEVNAAAVELCLMNFVSNALKYADDTKADRWVRISGRAMPASGDEIARVIIDVTDNGRGIPPEQRARLFERFYRAGVDVITGVEGTGLGLSIVRETVESLRGTAWVEFPASGGTTFAFSLPSRRADDPTRADDTPLFSAVVR